MARKSVAFGPWIGELGWELNSWQGFVRKAARGRFADYDVHVLTVPGRECLYKDVDATFHGHPKWFCDIDYSARAYATDYWTPKGPRIKDVKKYDGPFMKEYAHRLLDEYKKILPDTEFIVPWRRFEWEGVEYGGVTSNDYIPKEISGEHQHIIFLCTGIKYADMLDAEIESQGFSKFDKAKRLFSFFPRGRTRNAARNWPEKYYVKLSKMIQKEYPHLLPAFIGSPGGALFKGGCPDGVLDLIHLKDPDNMLNIHMAAMSNTEMGIGPSSGMLHIAAYAKMPFICNIDARTHRKYPNRFTIDYNPFGCRIKMMVGDQSLDAIRSEIRGFISALR